MLVETRRVPKTGNNKGYFIIITAVFLVLSSIQARTTPQSLLRFKKLLIPNQVGSHVMDNIVDALNNAYREFVAAAASVLEVKESSGGQKTAATDAALENFKQRWELFRVACDQAEEFVESVKQRIGSECLVDEATGSVVGKPGQAASTGLPPISAVRLEQMSKAVRWLVIELQHGSGTSGSSSHPHPPAPFDARFSEDAAQ